MLAATPGFSWTPEDPHTAIDLLPGLTATERSQDLSAVELGSMAPPEVMATLDAEPSGHPRTAGSRQPVLRRSGACPQREGAMTRYRINELYAR